MSLPFSGTPPPLPLGAALNPNGTQGVTKSPPKPQDIAESASSGGPASADKSREMALLPTARAPVGVAHGKLCSPEPCRPHCKLRHHSHSPGAGLRCREVVLPPPAGSPVPSPEAAARQSRTPFQTRRCCVPESSARTACAGESKRDCFWNPLCCGSLHNELPHTSRLNNFLC